MSRLSYLGVFLLAVSWFWLAGSAVSASEYSYSWVAESDRAVMKSGESQSVWVELENTGTATWINDGENAVKIGTVRERDRASAFYGNDWLSSNRAVSSTQTVAPGDIGRFEFEVSAGLPVGIHREYFSLVAEGMAWFDGPDFYIDIEVLPTKFDGSLVSSPNSLVLKTGEVAVVSVQVRNTSDVAWNNTGLNAAKIGTIGPKDRRSAFYSTSWLSPNRVTSADTVIAPGNAGEFSFSLSAPDRIGSYQEKFGIVVEGLAWLDVEFTVDITVQPAIYSASFVRQSEHSMVTPGETVSLWVELKNDGNTVWQNTGDNAAKLGTAGPLDRESLFYHPSWLGSNRIATLEAPVSPGGVGRFIFTVQAPNKIDTYREHVRPVIENVTWMEDLGIYWDISVNEELVLTDPVRVGLSATTDMVTISSTQGMVIRRGDRGLVAKVPAGQNVVSVPISGGYQVSVGGNNYTVKDYLRFIPLKNSIISVNNSQVSSTYNSFRGIVVVRRSVYSGRVWMVNELELEDYLRGLAEVPESWPLEARKAQVVAARTFALRRVQDPRAIIFDLYDDTQDQVYFGFNYEMRKPGIAQAVEATKGVIVSYGGQPALTYYHSDSGGAIDNVVDIWGGSIPYLQAKPDPYSKRVTWSTTLNQNYVQDRFDGQMSKVGALGETIIDMIIDERYPSGRMKQITLVTNTGKRASMGIKTFDYLTPSSTVKSMNFTVSKLGSASSPDFVLTGVGNGHGIGLSQWSAYNMANQGQTYEQILKYFYTGVQVAVLNT